MAMAISSPRFVPRETGVQSVVDHVAGASFTKILAGEKRRPIAIGRLWNSSLRSLCSFAAAKERKEHKEEGKGDESNYHGMRMVRTWTCSVLFPFSSVPLLRPVVILLRDKRPSSCRILDATCFSLDQVPIDRTARNRSAAGNDAFAGESLSLPVTAIDAHVPGFVATANHRHKFPRSQIGTGSFPDHHDLKMTIHVNVVVLSTQR